MDNPDAPRAVKPWWWNWLALWEFVSVWGVVIAFDVFFETNWPGWLWNGGGFVLALIGALITVYMGRYFALATPEANDERP